MKTVCQSRAYRACLISMFTLLIIVCGGCKTTQKAQGNNKDLGEVLWEVQQVAQVKGGDQALREFVDRYVPFKSEGSQAPKKRIFCRFIVDKKGKIHQPEIVRGAEYKDLATPILENISKIKMIPAEHHGKKVSMYLTIPFTFR